MGIFYVYILKCRDHHDNLTLYTGSTQNLMKRFDQHQKGKGARYTKGKHLDLAYYETHLSRSSAMKREIEIKTFSADKKWALIKDFEQKMLPDASL